MIIKETRSEYNLRTYKNKVSSNLCVDCKNPTESESVRCNNCRIRVNNTQKKRQKKYVAEGRCRDCGKQAETTNRSLMCLYKRRTNNRNKFII